MLAVLHVVDVNMAVTHLLEDAWMIETATAEGAMITASVALLVHAMDEALLPPKSSSRRSGLSSIQRFHLAPSKFLVVPCL